MASGRDGKRRKKRHKRHPQNLGDGSKKRHEDNPQKPRKGSWADRRKTKLQQRNKRADEKLSWDPNGWGLKCENDR